MPGDTSTETGEWADSSTPWTDGPVGEDAGGSGSGADVGSSDPGSSPEPLGFGDGSSSPEDSGSDSGEFGSGSDSGEFGSGSDSGKFGSGSDSGEFGSGSDSGEFGSGQDSGDFDSGSSDSWDFGSSDGSSDGTDPGGGDSGGTGAGSEADFVRDLGERLGLSIDESSLGGRQEIAAALTDLQGLYDRLPDLDRVVLDAVVEDGVQLSGATDESGSALDLPGAALLDLAARCRQPVSAVLGHAQDSYRVAYGTSPVDDATA